MTDTKLDQFTLAYIECALWSSNEESDESGGKPLDRNYSIDDLAPETLAAMVEDCRKFQETHGEAIAASEAEGGEGFVQAGHDFWLTRNHHGAGFWDGDWPEPFASQITDACHNYGEVNLYIGDDDKIYAA
jgi:hypothetical protein